MTTESKGEALDLNKTRAEFEAEMHKLDIGEYALTRDDIGDYVDEHIACYWNGWQMALARASSAATAGLTEHGFPKPPLPEADDHTPEGARRFKVTTLANYGTECFKAGERAVIASLAAPAETAEPSKGQPIIGKLLDDFSALPVLWGMNEPGALVRHSDVFRMLIDAGKAHKEGAGEVDAKDAARLAFLHSTNRDADGWEWGIARVRVVGGKVEYLWGCSDHSDLDAAIAAQPKDTTDTRREA